jgi:hypothetical protein
MIDNNALITNLNKPKTPREKRGSSNVSQVSNEASAKMSRVSEVQEPVTGHVSPMDRDEKSAQYELPND